MSFFGKLQKTGLEENQDRLGGYQPLETGIYTGTIKQAYAGQSLGGAKNVTLIVDVGGKEYRETIYITNKQGENFFLNKDDKTKKVALPGFTTVDDICTVTTGKGLPEQDVEDKMVKVYDPEAKRELPKSVPVLVELLGQEVSLGIGKIWENKSQKVNDVYVATADERFTNVIEKVFHTETKMTVVEATKGDETGTFWGLWEERNKGLVRDKRTFKNGAGGMSGPPMGGRPVAGPPVANSNVGAGGAPVRKSLFGAKAS